MIGNTPLGGNNPIRVQSMTNTDTMDTDACVAQIKRIVEAGGEYVRLTAQGTREAENLRDINAALRAEGMPNAELACVRCPIGLPVGADSPQQIAVSVVAELLAARAGTLQRLRIDD